MFYVSSQFRSCCHRCGASIDIQLNFYLYVKRNKFYRPQKTADTSKHLFQVKAHIHLTQRGSDLLYFNFIICHVDWLF